MERQDYTTLISHYIPNEKKYHFVFPIHILNQYNGPDNLDVTLDDNLTYYIIYPILKERIEYNFEIIWEDIDGKKSDFINICVSVNNDKFDTDIVIKNLILHEMINGLELYVEEYGKLNKIYG
ncbi:hypothetical protein [uncultured Tenacibaculum sp.]|uniref:hypothetical protein n=1 Tax=uncultured Tenacibaculum sp. TaxID=174713 RepID=UPI00262B1B06|nr:hypothetical protein [uncultured Tenacibaculum sp.]